MAKIEAKPSLNDLEVNFFNNKTPSKKPRTKSIKKGSSMDICHEQPIFNNVSSKLFILLFGKYNQKQRSQ
jgi:hypothetical protein